MEVADRDLTKLELAVLSTCETGLGGRRVVRLRWDCSEHFRWRDEFGRLIVSEDFWAGSRRAFEKKCRSAGSALQVISRSCE